MSEASERPVERVGVILVHGIGEQRRFQHLDGQSRELIRALQAMQERGDVEQVSIDVASAGAAAFHAEQDTWSAGPRAAVTFVVHHELNGQPSETRLCVHEVWWADVNEPYSLAKQFRFWLWGLAVWLHPGKGRSHRPSAHRVEPITVGRGLSLWNRVQLFLVGTFFVLVGYSIGIISFLLSRLFNLQQPKLLRVLANYISAVKLYSQRRRFGEGLIPHDEEFIDSVGEPPRVSIRRRMMRTIADVACNRYGRWYILAHSQGTVVAFNGLMDSAYAWPGYLDERRWKRLKRTGFAGNAHGRYLDELPSADDARETLPRRPGWAEPNEIVFRDGVFDSFRGFLTYGSPLAKFAGIWPAVVPVSREPAFHEDVPWINLYDPVDPVSGRLEVFCQPDQRICPFPIDLGYAASPVLLLAHLKYFARRAVPMDAATATVRWLLTGCAAAFPLDAGHPSGWKTGQWFKYRDRSWRARIVVAYSTWIIATAVLALLGALIFPLLLKAASSVGASLWTQLSDFSPDLSGGKIARSILNSTTVVSDWVATHQGTFARRMLLLVSAAVVLTAIAGGIARLFFFKRDGDDPRR